MRDEAEKIVKPHPIPVEFFSRKSNKTTQLIENDDEEKVLDGRNRWYEFELDDPIYARGIEVFTTGYSNWNEIELQVFHLDGTRHHEKIKLSDNTASLRLGKLIKGFRFRPDTKLLTDPKIERVSVNGLTLEEFHAYEWALKDFDDREKKLQQREATAENLAVRVRELSSERAELVSEVGKSKAELSKLQEAIASSAQALEEEKSKRSDLTQEISGLRDERRGLNEDIRSQETRLTELTKQVRLFPSEIAGFVKEGNRNIRWYTGISVPFVAIICIILGALFSSAIDLTQLWRREQDIDIWTVFLTRIPFVVVAITILEVCGYVVGRLIFEIIKINRQRLSLSKLSIIAKDVTTASAHNTDLSGEEIFQKETELKMELLRDHMKEYVSEEFAYKGTAIQSAITAIAEKVAGGGKA